MARARLYEPRPTGARRWARGVSLGPLAALPLVRFPVLISSLLRSGCIFPLKCGDLALILLLVDMDIYLYTKVPCIGTKETHEVAPTEDESVNLKSLFFIVLVFVYSKGVLVRIKMPLEVARTTRMVSRGWGLGRKFCCSFKSL